MSQLLKILNLGCGDTPMANAVNLDRTRHSPHVDVAFDLNRPKWPFPDRLFQEIHATDLLEHLDDFPQFFREAHRLLLPEGMLHVRVPHADSPNVAIDPTHRRGYVPACFEYLDHTLKLGAQYGLAYTEGRWWRLIQLTTNYEEMNIYVTLRKEEHGHIPPFQHPVKNTSN